jgi:sulfate transport system permease protein
VSTDLATRAEPDPLESPAAQRVRRPKPTKFGREPTGVRWTLRVICVVYVVMLVAWPTYLVFERALAPGLGTALKSLRDPEVGHAIYLTLYITFFAVLINLVFGLTVSILLVRYDFPGKRVLSTLLDVPLSISPVVVGLALVLVYNGRHRVRRPAAGDP